MTSGRGTNQLTWVPVGPLPATDEHPATTGGISILRGGRSSPTTPSPSPARRPAMGWDPVANLVHAAGDSAVGVIEPHGDSRSGYGVYDEVDIGGEPLALGFDVSDTSQTDDHGQLIVATAGGDAPELVRIDISQNAFAWRFAATIFGALLAGLVYLLTAMLFRRRSIAILAGVFVAIDLMSFTMSRIAMNDIFVALFIAAGLRPVLAHLGRPLGAQRVVGPAPGGGHDRPGRRARSGWAGTRSSACGSSSSSAPSWAASWSWGRSGSGAIAIGIRAHGRSCSSRSGLWPRPGRVVGQAGPARGGRAGRCRRPRWWLAPSACLRDRIQTLDCGEAAVGSRGA